MQKHNVPSFFWTKTTGLAQGLLEGWITLASCISYGLQAISSLTAKGAWRAGYFCGMASPVSI